MEELTIGSRWVHNIVSTIPVVIRNIVEDEGIIYVHFGYYGHDTTYEKDSGSFLDNYQKILVKEL